MSQDTKKYKRIRAEEAAELQGWELPQMSGPLVVPLQQKEVEEEVVVVEEEIAAEKITVAELESIRETARVEGLAAGLEEGRAQGVEQGRAEGHKLGQEQGYQDGINQGSGEMQRLQQILSGLIAQVESPLSQSTQVLENQLLQMVLSLSRSVVGHELETRKELLLASIQESLSHFPEPLGSVKVMANPSDEDYLKQALSDVAGDIEIVVDQTIQAGGYKLEALNTQVEFEVESRFQHVAEQLLQNIRQGQEPGND